MSRDNKRCTAYQAFDTLRTNNEHITFCGDFSCILIDGIYDTTSDVNYPSYNYHDHDNSNCTHDDDTDHNNNIHHTSKKMNDSFLASNKEILRLTKIITIMDNRGCS